MFIIVFFFFNDTATTEIYTLSLHDALPIWIIGRREQGVVDDHAVPTGAFEAERDVGPHAVRTAQIRFARRFALQPARDRQTAGIHDRRRQLGPVDGEHQTEQVAQPFAADVQLGRFEANELP